MNWTLKTNPKASEGPLKRANYCHRVCCQDDPQSESAMIWLEYLRVGTTMSSMDAEKTRTVEQYL